jgi:DNA repair exonuclease SbcCD ATPase subunit
MDGLRLDLAPGLNCIIGARGTGKTTVIEFIRYALDLMPSKETDPSGRRRIESLLERNLAGGILAVRFETKDGLVYTASRAGNEDVVVFDHGKKPTQIQLRAGGFLRANIYSQNEVEWIADQALSQLDLIDNFESQRIAEVESQIRQAEARLAENSHAMVPLQERLAWLDDELNQLAGVEEKLKGHVAAAGGGSDAINKAHAQKALRDRERRTAEGVHQVVDEYGQQLEALVGLLSRKAGPHFRPDVLTGANNQFIKAMRQAVQGCSSEVDKLLGEAVKRVQAARSDIAEKGDAMALAHAQQEQEFRALIEKHQVEQGQATERAQLERRRNELLALKVEREEKAAQLKNIEDDRVALLAKLSELRDARYGIRSEVAKRITKELRSEVRIRVDQYGNRVAYAGLLAESLKNAGIKHQVVAQKLAGAFSPADLAAVIKRGDMGALSDKADLSEDRAEKVLDALSEWGVLHSLEAVELLDQPCIELKDGDVYKPSTDLSTGQKCTTILPILLLDSENPLLVDQPEDNLDNSFIFDKVVQKLRDVKARRQLIFVTHNPNIPVLGDAERVFVLDSDGKTARLAKAGNVDECRQEIVTLLEGGEKAFRMRRERYKLP